MSKERIRTLDQLRQAVEDKRSVIIPSWTHSGKATSIPAAFAYDFNGSLLHLLFERGMYLYPKNEKGNKNDVG